MFLTIPQVDFAAKVQAQQEFETYESEEFGFTIEHPFDWKPSEPSSFEIEMIGHVPYVIKFELPGSLNDDVYVRKWRPAVTVYVDILQGLTSLEEYVSEQIDSRVVSFASKINSTDTILSGNPAYKLNSTQPGGNIKTMSIYAMNDEGRIYSLDYSAHEATFDTYLPIVQKMIDSFKIYTNTSESQSNAAQGQEPEVSLQNNSTPEQDSMAQSEFTIGEEMVEEEPSAELESEEAIDNTGRGNRVNQCNG